MDVFLAGGGVRGLCHPMFLKAVKELRVPYDRLTCVSAGTLAGTFDRNGFSPDETFEIFCSEEMRRPSSALASPLSFLNPLTYLAGGVINIEEFVRGIVDRYKLKPQPDLRIVAYNVLRREPIIFEGTDYDLTKAIAASCAVPFVMRPVLYFPERFREARFLTGQAEKSMSRSGLLVDGGVHHITPVELSDGPALVSMLPFATGLPREWLSPVDWYFHLVEMFWAPLLNWYFQVPDTEHVVIKVAPSNVAALTFGISERTCREMGEYAYRTSLEGVGRAIAEGRVPTVGKRRQTASR